MSQRIFIRVAGPTIFLGLGLLAFGIVAAWKVQNQQWQNSELIQQEVNGVLVTEDLFLIIRELRRELDLYLRTHNHKHLDNVKNYLADVDYPLSQAKTFARTEKEAELIEVVDQGIAEFINRFNRLSVRVPSAESDDEFAQLNDVFLTNEILGPIHETIKYNRQVVDRTASASLITAQHVGMGFLLLGISGSAAGLLSGIAIANGLKRSIIKLDVSVRGVAGKLNEVGGLVHFSHFSNLQELESTFARVEEEIGDVVERLQRRELELLRSEQLARVGHLAAGMAHEFRNSLMPIKVIVQTALEQPGRHELSEQQLRIIQSETRRLEESIRTLLDFARPPNPRFEEVDVSQLIQETIDLLTARAEKQLVNIQFSRSSKNVIASVDKTLIRQLLLNILLNALDVMNDGGTVTIELIPDYRGIHLHTKNTSDQTMHSDDDSASQSFAIIIHDVGPGFPPEVMSRIFEPFVTTKETGTGLGLSICKRTVDVHNGEIRVKNLPVRGCEYEIVLPYTSKVRVITSDPIVQS